MALTTVLWGIASSARADELRLSLDTGWFDDDVFNQRFSDTSGLDARYIGDLAERGYLEFRFREGLDPSGDSDRELDIGGGFVIPPGDEESGTEIDLYFGRWLYGEDVDEGDWVFLATLTAGNANFTAARLEGVTDDTILRPELVFPVRETLDLSLSAAYATGQERVNPQVRLSWEFSEGWTLDGIVLHQTNWETEKDEWVIGARLSRTLQFDPIFGF